MIMNLAVDELFDIIPNALKKQNSLSLVLCTFEVRKRAARAGLNPKINEALSLSLETRLSMVMLESCV